MIGRGSADDIARDGVAAALEKKASDLYVLNLSDISSFADYFVICSAGSERQAHAIADAIEETLRIHRRRPISSEGYVSARWILLDYGEVVFHIFLEEARRFYALERLWGDAGDETRRFAAAH